MSGFAIFYVEEIWDKQLLREYQISAFPTLATYCGKVTSAYGRTEVVEGDPIAGVVTIAFPTFEDARNWYHSEGYQKAKAIRVQGVRCHVVLIEGK